MFKNHKDKHIQDFITYGSKSYSGNGLPSFQEPTYVGFAIKFDYNDEVHKSDPDAYTSGLLGGESDMESAINYLLRTGKDTEATYLNKFIQILKDIETNKPWYFQTVTGLNEIWKVQQEGGKNWRGQDIILSIDCLETMDMRMSFLAALYNQAVYDKKWQRTNLPQNKRTFRCQIVIADTRNIGTMEKTVYHPDFQKENPQVGPPVPTASNTGIPKGPTANKPVSSVTSAYANSGLTATGVDSNSKWGSFVQTAVSKKVSDKLTSVDAYTSIANGNSVVNTPTNVKDSIKFSENEKTKQQLSDSLSKMIFLEISNKINYFVFDLHECEFIFNDTPWLETVDINNFTDMAKMKFQIKVGYPTEVHQFRFYDWILADLSVGGQEKDFYTRVAASDMLKSAPLGSDYIYDANSYSKIETAMNAHIESRNPVQNQRDIIAKQADMAKQSPADRGNAWDAVINSQGSKVTGALNQAEAYAKKNKDSAFGKELNKVKDKVAKSQLLSTKADDLYNKVKNINFSDPYSVISAYNTGNEAIALLNDITDNGTKSKLPHTNWQNKPTVKSSFMFNSVRALNELQKTKNIFWKNATASSWNNMKNPDDLGYFGNANKSTIDNTNNINAVSIRTDGSNTYKNALSDGSKISSKKSINQIKSTGDDNHYFKTHFGNIDLGYGTRTDPKTGKSFTNVYGDDERAVYERKNTTIADISLIGFKELKTISDISLEGPDKNKTIGDITLEGFKESKTISDISLEGPDKNKSITDISLEGPTPKDKIHDLSLKGPRPKDRITDIKQKGPKPKLTLDDITLKGPIPKDKLNDINLEGPRPKDKLTDIKQTGEPKKKTLTQVKLDGYKAPKKLNDIKLEGYRDSHKLNGIKLQGAAKKESLGQVSMAGVAAKKDLSQLKSDPLVANNKLTGLKFEGASKKDKLTGIKGESLVAKDKISDIKFEGVSKKDKITDISLEGFKESAKISDIELVGPSKKNKIEPKTIEQKKPTVNNKISKV